MPALSCSLVGQFAGSLAILAATACSSSETATTSGTDGSIGSGGGSATSDSGVAGASSQDAPSDASPPTCNPGTTWSILDDYVYSATTVQNNPSTIAFAKNGDLLVSGLTVDNGTPIGIIRKSQDGTTWSLLSQGPGLGGDLAVAPDGALFASGGNGGRSVQKSSDDGKTWKQVDSVPFADATACNTGWIGADSKGVVYFASSCDSEGWLTRRSIDGGTTWSNVGDFYTLEPGMPARLADLHVDGSDRVFISGQAQDKMSVGHWIVRRLEPAGTWTTVDDFQLEAGGSASSPQLAGSGRLYAAGEVDTPTAKHWIVRRSDPGGDGWKTIDDFTDPTATGMLAIGTYEASNGTLLAIGQKRDGANIAHTITRRSTDDGKTWTGIEDWMYMAGKGTGPGPLVASSAGTIFGTARGLGLDDRAHWLVRKLACAP